MNLLFTLVVHTANILGIFTDPFEFEGDYGEELNPIRKQVFERVVSKEALAKNLSDLEIKVLLQNNDSNSREIEEYRKFLIQQSINQEKDYGPTLSELITPDLIEEIKKKQSELESVGFSKQDLENILFFINCYQEQKIFHFLRNNPPELLNLDKILKDQAAREGKSFDLPILGSSKLLEGTQSQELKSHLLESLFTQEIFLSTPKNNHVKTSLEKLDKDYLNYFFGDSASTKDLEIFATPAGQIFFYWMYQALNLHLVSENPEMIKQINKVKQIFSQTLGNPYARANQLRNKLIEAQSDVLFTQESDALFVQTLTANELYHSVEKQNPQDGTFVFLKSDLWNSDYEIIPIDHYEGFKKGRLNLILATKKETGQKFLLASCHGHSTNPEDGRQQISYVMEKFQQLSDGTLQLIIGIDANTKTEEDVKKFREHLDTFGLTATSVGPTTIKRRMVTTQHSKAGRFAIDEEDYLITLKPENGGQFLLDCQTIGFRKGPTNLNETVPNMYNPSDHYPVGAILKPVPYNPLH